MTLPGPAAKGNSLIHRRLSPTSPNTHKHILPSHLFLPTPEGKRKDKEERGDDEAIDRAVDIHSLRTVETT